MLEPAYAEQKRSSADAGAGAVAARHRRDDTAVERWLGTGEARPFAAGPEDSARTRNASRGGAESKHAVWGS